MQRIAILVASLVGLAFCALAALDARAQQAEDLASMRPAPADPATHHMRGKLSRTSTAPAQRLVAGGHVLG